MRRATTAVVGLVLVMVALAGLILLLQSRDQSSVEGAEGPGVADEVTRPAGAPLVTRDRRALPDDQIAHARALGNVVIVYPGEDAPRELVELQRELSSGFDPEVAAAGQSVILASGEDFEALAWERRLDFSDPADPRVREFAEHWLGRGAPAR